MSEVLTCYGCGAVIQSEDPNQAGYVPKRALTRDHILCQRCFRMKHYHELTGSPLTADDFLTTLASIASRDGLILYMLDGFDLDGSMIPGLSRHLAKRDFLVVVNKVDLLDRVKEAKLIFAVRKKLAEQGLKVLDVLLVSCKNQEGLEDVFGAIDYYAKGRDTYVVGMANVGKSSLINALIARYEDDLITTGEFPGTTLATIAIDFGNGTKIYDTPGFLTDRQMTAHVRGADLSIVLPDKAIRTRVYQLDSGQTLYVGGLARLDFISGKHLGITAYFSRNLRIHRTKTIHADGIYDQHRVLNPYPENVLTVDQLKAVDFHLPPRAVDIWIAGLGWFYLKNPDGHFRVYVPDGVAVGLRDHIY